MTIICATDFSKPAAEARDIAANMAVRRGERLLLWHAVQPQIYDSSGSIVDMLCADSKAQIEIDAQRIRQSGITVGTEVVVSWLDEEFQERMPEDTTLIVAGARGHTRGTHWLIGSNVERLARVTTVPLLVVREASRLRSWLEGQRNLRVILATDLSAVSDHVLRRSALLEGLGPCDVELLYVEYPPAEYARFGVSGPIRIPHSHPVIDEMLSRELSVRAAKIDLGGEVTTEVAQTLGDAGAAITAEAEERNADLIVVGSHQRNALSRMWHGSIAHNVLHSAETNVLIVPFHSADEDVRALAPPALRTVLVATDLSPCGNRAVAWACATAPADARIVVMTVVARESEKDEASNALTAVKATVLASFGGRIDTDVVVGKDPADSICAAAERESADLVVVGRHGTTRIGHLFLGSVASGVLAHSRKPVLVVPDPAIF